MRREGGIPAKELAARVPLAELVGEVVKLRRTGRSSVGLCPFHAEKTPSFNVYGDGKYKCFGCDAHGDALDFLQEYHGLTFGQAVDHLKARLGIAERGSLAPLKPRPAPVAHEGERDRKDGVMLWCMERWSEAMVSACGPVEEYLLGRGIDADLLGGLPECLRFHPKTWHGEAGRHLWAMVARIEDARGLMCGIHRTFLEARDAVLCEVQPLAVQKLRGAWPRRVVTKADVPGAKKMNGTAKGGCVRLAPAGRSLGIAEGIETALAVMQETEMPVWAALSLGNLGNLTIPPHVHELVLFADNDMKDKAAAEKIIQFAAAGYARSVPSVRIARPPEGMDFNDLLLQELLRESSVREASL